MIAAVPGIGDRGAWGNGIRPPGETKLSEDDLAANGAEGPEGRCALQIPEPGEP